ncbi:hypothetical protein [Neptunitalea lumnitzerae]|uniref:Uncharacterized protein n=1 Tax=Neptunitalea lumnitzerae TaxID=2965509 RepID=A0ABQ5MF43_9FLAO|nr:hypothetical protein [Neptunitalea sp. Y10]GLB48009.1 hypothetical protein Y10_03770 [Neptunitalea sp. Y10]
MINKEKRLEELLIKLKDYNYIKEKLYDDPTLLSSEEQDVFIEENKTQVLEMTKIIKEINKLEWDMMTKEQQQNYLDKYADD